jgi:hypothetical protein
MKKSVFGLTVAALVIAVGTSLSAQTAADFQYTASNGKVTITGYTGSAKNVTIPGRIDGLPVTTIGDRAFYTYLLTRVTIPGSVTVIGYGAFAGNDLTSVIIPNSVTAIGEMAFAVNDLTSVTIGNSVATIGRGAFGRNQLTSVTIPNSVTAIGEAAFRTNQLTSVTIPASIDVTEGDYPSFDGNLMQIYTSGGKRAGTYRSGDGGKTWTRQ